MFRRIYECFKHRKHLPITQMLQGAGICAYIWVIYGVNVGICSIHLNIEFWLVVTGTYIGNSHPNWLSYFSEGWLNHQPECVYFPPAMFDSDSQKVSKEITWLVIGGSYIRSGIFFYGKSMGESPISIAISNAGTIAFSPFPLVKLLGCPVLSHAQLPNSLVYNPFKLVGYIPPKKNKSR